MKIYVIMTYEDLDSGESRIVYKKGMFFMKQDAFKAAEAMGEIATVMEFEFTHSWNHEQIQQVCSEGEEQ